MREKKWHVFNKDTNQPLTWDGQAVEFDSEEAAIKFLNNCNERGLYTADAEVREAILYYDSGYINLTGVFIDENDRVIWPHQLPIQEEE